MKVKWIVEKGLFTDTEENLIKAIKDSGREVMELIYIPFEDDLPNIVESKCNSTPAKPSCCIFYGSLNFGRKILKTSLVPGIFLNDKMFECTSYYPVFGNELVHSEYIMMPYGDIKRRKDFIFNLFGDMIFIRPNSGYKEFTGLVLDKNNFEYGVDLAKFYSVSSNLLCLISSVKDFLREWRFVVVEGKVISGSLYRDWTIGSDCKIGGSKDIVLLNSKSVSEICKDEKATEYANKICKLYDPDKAWALDVALTKDGNYELIEIGCFSCAGMYGNDLVAVVNAVSNAAEKEWEEYFYV